MPADPRPSSAYSPAQAAPSGPSAPRRTRLLRAELRCHLCAELRGVLEAPSQAGFPPRARLLPTAASPGGLVAWRSLRCLRCGSASLFLDEPETVTLRLEQVDWALDWPRRGRPPRWLAALRARQSAA